MNSVSKAVETFFKVYEHGLTASDLEVIDLTTTGAKAAYCLSTKSSGLDEEGAGVGAFKTLT